MKINKLVIFLCFYFFCLVVFSQQLPLHSQYLYNPLVINPAFSGITESSSIILMNRNQWVGFVEDGIKTTSISGHHALNNQKHGVGSLLFSDRTGAISIHGLDLMYSFKFPLFLDYNLSLGISANLYQYILDESKIEYNEPEATNFGDYQKKINFDSNFGIFLYDEFLFFGASVVNIIQSKVLDEQEGSEYNQLVRNYYFLGGYNFSDKNSKLGFEQSFLLRKTQFTDFQYDINLKAIFNDIFWLGAGYRSDDEIVALFGFEYNRFSLIYSIDYNYGEIGSHSGSSHEFSLVYYLRQGSSIDWKKNRILLEKY